MDLSALLDDLDPDQRRAVTTESRLVAVIAGAGSGKTRVLTRRVAHRVVTGTAEARHTLVLTFTREAAGELRRRLMRLGLTERVEAGTFHSVVLGLLRQRWTDLDRRPPTVVNDRRRLLTEALGGTRRAPGHLDDIAAEIDWASARGIVPAQYSARAMAAGRRPSAGTSVVAEAYEAYRTLKRQRGVIDLDDVLALGVEALERDQEFADATRWRYRHLLVDEAQDLDPLQHRLVDLLRRGSDDVFIVGDPAQAIYGFNGADPSLLVEVADRFPGIEVIRLPANHRCTPAIVGTGVHVLERSDQRAPLHSTRPDGGSVEIVRCDDESAEVRVVVDTIRRIDPGRVRAGQVAVLGRTHALLAPIRRALDDAGVLVRRRIDGPGSPYRDPIAEAARLGSASALRSWAHEALERTADDDVATRATEQEVADAVLDFVREQPHGDGAALRSWIAATDPFELRGERGVELLTFHAAKGREWHHVIVAGVETGLVPHRSATTAAAKAEEARLLYVALTRATDDLTVTWAERRGGYKRRPTPYLVGYEPAEAIVVPPPPEIVPADDDARRHDRELRDAVAGWRDRTARAAGLLPEHLCDDYSLRRIVETDPTSPDELAAVTTLGRITAGRLFDGLRAALDDVQSRRSSTTGA